MRQRLELSLAWLWRHLRQLAHEYNVTVFLSSHVLNEVEQVADWIGIINRGRLIFQAEPHELQRYQALTVVTNRGVDAATALKANGLRAAEASGDLVNVPIVSDGDIASINQCLVENGIHVYRLERKQEALEDLFRRLVAK